MKYIKKFDELIVEAHGFPNSLIPIYDIAFDEMLKKFDYWYSRKGFAFYRDDINLMMDKEITDNKDFPLEFLNIDFKILYTSPRMNKVSGWAHSFRNKREKDSDVTMSKSYRNKINAKMSITIHPGDAVDRHKIESDLSQSLRHELLHLYQDYKVLNHVEISDIDVIYANTLVNSFINNRPSSTLATFIIGIYQIVNKKEYSAHLSQAGSKYVNSDKDIPYFHELKKMLNKYSFDELYNKISSEIIRGGKVPDTLVLNFKKDFEKDLKVYKKKKPSWFDRFTKPDFKDFLKNLYDLSINRRGTKYRKKMNKILATKT